jgi:hypothetical protein
VQVNTPDAPGEATISDWTTVWLGSAVKDRLAGDTLNLAGGASKLRVTGTWSVGLEGEVSTTVP